MSDNLIYGLVCAGGGAHGAYQVGVGAGPAADLVGIREIGNRIVVD
jgi:hypothetical protein